MEGGGAARSDLTGRKRDIALATAGITGAGCDDWSLAARTEAALAAVRKRSKTRAANLGATAAGDAPEPRREAELDGICETLRQTDVFANLDERHLRGLARGCSQQTWPENRLVFRCGDPSDAVFVVREGSVDVLRDQRGKPLRRLARLTTGDIFGELGVLHGVGRSASVRTVEPCRLLRIDQRTFQRFLKADADAQAKLEALATRRHCYNAAAALDSRKDARIRIDAEVTLLPAAERCRLTHLEDISRGGLSLTGVPAGWQPEQPASFTLIATGTRLCVTGRVVWRRGETIGFAFSGNIPSYGLQVTRFTRTLLEELAPETEAAERPQS